MVDVPRLQTEWGQIAPTAPSAPSQSAGSSVPWGLLRYPREPSNLFPLMGSVPTWPDRLRQTTTATMSMSYLLQILPSIMHHTIATASVSNVLEKCDSML